MKFFINATFYIYIHTEPLISFTLHTYNTDKKKSLSLVSIFFENDLLDIVGFFSCFFLVFFYSKHEEHIHDKWHQKTATAENRRSFGQTGTGIRKQGLIESTIEIIYIVATEATFFNLIDWIVNSGLRKFNSILK